MLSLIVTADDFGIGLQTSRGIIDAHLRGPVTATSLMVVTGDHVRASIPLLADAPNLDVGLHLVLTRCGEKPIMARESSGLVDRDGQFFSNRQLWYRAFTGKLERHGIADEISAQAQLFNKLCGKPPAYVDAHHHAHQLPIIRDALLDVMGADLLPRVTRLSIETPGIRRSIGLVRLKRAAANFLGHSAAKVFAGHWLWSNDSFFGMLSSRDLRRPFPWAKYLAHLPTEGAVEWVVHPGRTDETLVGRDAYIPQRVAELHAFFSDAGRKLWEPLRPNLARKSQLHRKLPED